MGNEKWKIIPLLSETLLATAASLRWSHVADIVSGLTAIGLSPSDLNHNPLWTDLVQEE